MTKRTFGGSVVQHLTGTASQWTSVNPVLAKGEFGIEIDTNLIKVGDGVTTWKNLSYINQACSIPVGHVQQQYTVESGYLALDGSTYSRTTYAALWAWATAQSLTAASPSAYQFGTGDGSTTFTVPNHTGRVWQGSSAAGSKEAGLPNITGTLGAAGAVAWQQPTGAFSLSGTTAGAAIGSGSGGNITLNFSATNSNSIYGASTTVQPPAILLIPQIKY